MRWRAAQSTTDKALKTAAITQHEFAKAVRARKRRPPRMTTDTLAAHANLTVDQLRRILRGETHMTLAHMHLIAAHVDLPLASAGNPRP